MKSDSTPISYKEALRKAETLYGNPLDLPDKTTEKAYDINCLESIKEEWEAYCNGLTLNELNDFVLEQLFYFRQRLYCYDGHLFIRSGNHLEELSNEKIECQVLSILRDKFVMIGKRSRAKAVSDLIRLCGRENAMEISFDKKIIAFSDGILDVAEQTFIPSAWLDFLLSHPCYFSSRYELPFLMSVLDNDSTYKLIYFRTLPIEFLPPYSTEHGTPGPCHSPHKFPEEQNSSSFPFPNICEKYNELIAKVNNITSMYPNPNGRPTPKVELWEYPHDTGLLRAIIDVIKGHPTPTADKFFLDIADGNLHVIERIYQMIGYILVPGNEAKAYFLLQGESNSGKSILGKFLEGYFPPELVTSLDISRLGGQYLPDALSTSCLNLSMDLPNGKMSAKSVAVLKMLTGDDIITHEVKYKDAKPYRNKCKFVFSTNFPLDMQIYDQAFLNRTVCIPFAKSVPYDKQDPALLDKLNSERFNITIKAICCYYILKAYNFRFSGDNKLKPKVVYRMEPNEIIRAFVETYCEITYSDNDFVATENLYSQYLAFCRDNNMSMLSSKAGFSQRLMYLYSPAIESDRKGDLHGYRRLKLYTSPVVFIRSESADGGKTPESDQGSSTILSNI